MEPATRTGCEGGPSSSPPDSPHCSSPDAASGDDDDDDTLPFDFMPEEAGSISATLPTDARGLINCILDVVFCPESPHPSRHYRPSSDAEAAELALLSYFLMLGPQRLHLLPQPPSQERKHAARAPFPSGPPQGAKESLEWLPPPVEARPSCRLDAAAAIPTISSEAGKEKAADLKRGSPDPSVFPSSTADEHSPESKKPRVLPHAASGGTCSLDAGVISTGHMPPMATGPPMADDGGRGYRKLPPSILCPASWEEGGAGDEGSTRVRDREPLPHVKHDGGKAPAAGAATHAPKDSSPVDQSLPAENARSVCSVDVADVKEGSLDKGDPSEPHFPSLTVQVEEPPPSRVGGDANSPFMTPELADLLKKFAPESIKLPRPKWWRPGGYDRCSSQGNK